MAHKRGVKLKISDRILRPKKKVVNEIFVNENFYCIFHIDQYCGLFFFLLWKIPSSSARKRKTFFHFKTLILIYWGIIIKIFSKFHPYSGFCRQSPLSGSIDDSFYSFISKISFFALPVAHFELLRCEFYGDLIVIYLAGIVLTFCRTLLLMGFRY